MHRAADAVIGGWTLSVINTATVRRASQPRLVSGAAGQVSDITTDWRGAISYRPNLIGTAILPDSARAGTVRYLDRAAFSAPTPDKPFGNLGRNAIMVRVSGSWI